MKQTWQHYMVLGVLLWALGLMIQILALAGQTDPYTNLSLEGLVSSLMIYPASILLVSAYLLRSDGGRQYGGYLLVMAGVLCLALLLVFNSALADLFMPRVWTPRMLLVNSGALIVAGVVYPVFRKSVKRELGRQDSR